MQEEAAENCLLVFINMYIFLNTSLRTNCHHIKKKALPAIRTCWFSIRDKRIANISFLSISLYVCITDFSSLLLALGSVASFVVGTPLNRGVLYATFAVFMHTRYVICVWTVRIMLIY